ncbi:putative nuclease HARBI1 [Mytilus edulis]|uniref:putative nuclease HARBI1 n=1 Tax=Mytilus edulis TaxID=6550 RepID=UPI0039F013CE
MPHRCCVPGCKASRGHRFPNDSTLRMKWRVAIRRTDVKTKKLWNPDHFLATDYRRTLSDDRCRLTENAIPSVFKLMKTCSEESPRAKRFKSRSDASLAIPLLINDDSIDVQYETEIETTKEAQESSIINVIESSQKSKNIQCDIPSFGKFSIESFKEDNKIINYYTGFQDFDHYMMFFHCLGPSAFELEFKCTLLNPIDQLFMTLIKLRQNKEDIELAMLFQVSQSTVSRIIITWINYLYFQLKEINIWPSQEILKETMPSDFSKKIPKTRVIMDATEIPIERPSNVESQSATWSNYKHKNTLKAMIGCSPRGAITFISDSYGGSASDRQIIEKSNLLDPASQSFEKGDSIMADRGILVQDLFANQGVQVNIPNFLKGKSQLDPAEVLHDRRVASKRIHIERVIGLTKSFKILKHGICKSKLQLGSRIVFICFAISNFRKNIVHRNA